MSSNYGECLEAQNDNIYIRTSIINNSFEDGAIPAVYNDSRSSNIVDDACSYELNVSRIVIPRANLPIKLIDPQLELNTTLWNRMPEALRIIVDTKTVEKNLDWVSELKEAYFDTSFIPNGNITQSIIDNKSYFTRYGDYYSLFTLKHFCQILNTAFLIAHNVIKGDLDVKVGVDINVPPIVSCINNIIRLHLPETYIIGNTPAKIPKIEFNNRLQLLFGKTLPFKYGRLRGDDDTKKWNEINTDITNNEWITDFDVSRFVSPFNNSIYTYNNMGLSQLPKFQSFGGYNRIEIYSNIPLVKKQYTQKQDTKTGDILDLNSNRENLLYTLYVNYNSDITKDIRYEGGYPFWQSISNSGALNEISYSIFTVDNLGNKEPLFLQFGKQINIDLQLRKVF